MWSSGPKLEETNNKGAIALSDIPNLINYLLDKTFKNSLCRDLYKIYILLPEFIVHYS